MFLTDKIMAYYTLIELIICVICRYYILVGWLNNIRLSLPFTIDIYLLREYYRYAAP